MKTVQLHWKTFTKPHIKYTVMQTQHRTTSREQKNSTNPVHAKPENSPLQDINAKQAKEVTTGLVQDNVTETIHLSVDQRGDTLLKNSRGEKARNLEYD
jgi:hypothetical protein